ncbi:hypothetical protein MRX96_018698 [Rhipicephalus microplus]
MDALTHQEDHLGITRDSAQPRDQVGLDKLPVVWGNQRHHYILKDWLPDLALKEVPNASLLPEPTTSGTPPRGSVHPTLHALMPRHGHPGSDKSPGTIIPGPTQASVSS